jgi:hypothetical protein
VRKALLIIGLLAALAVPAAATAAKPPISDVICGTACDGGGGGWSGCTQVTAEDHNGIRWLSYYRHYLIVNYCKSNGLITSASIVAHGCDFEGVMGCTTGPAWLESGGVGTGWAVYTGRAYFLGALGGVPFAGTSGVTVNIPLG